MCDTPYVRVVVYFHEVQKDHAWHKLAIIIFIALKLPCMGGTRAIDNECALC